MGAAALATRADDRRRLGPRRLRRNRARPIGDRSMNARGFTLLEVLVALVIIGVALAASMRGAMSLTSTAEYSRDKLLALLTAENRLLELRLARERLEPGEEILPCEQGGIAFICAQ